MRDVMGQFRRRWDCLWKGAGGPGLGCEQLLAQYAQPWRHYHDAGHIVACLEELEEYRAAGGMALRALELAIFFHDAVYDPRRHDNEEQSVRLAEEVLAPVVSSGELADVRLLILATRHEQLPTAADEMLVADVDLAILGKGEAEFAAYERGIRAEYRLVPEEQFRAGRMAVLRRFLERQQIYSTEYCRRRYEEAARGNLTRAIAKLTGMTDA